MNRISTANSRNRYRKASTQCRKPANENTEAELLRKLVKYLCEASKVVAELADSKEDKKTEVIEVDDDSKEDMEE